MWWDPANHGHALGVLFLFLWIWGLQASASSGCSLFAFQHIPELQGFPKREKQMSGLGWEFPPWYAHLGAAVASHKQ